MPTAQLLIGGVDKTGSIQPGTLRMPGRIGERSELSFSLKSRGYHPEVGSPVLLYMDAVLEFEGFVWEPEEKPGVQKAGETLVFVKVNCVDLHLLADRRRPNESYIGQTAGYIFADLVTKYLAIEGVTVGTIDAGPVVARAVFNRKKSLAGAFDELAEMAGFYWQIKPGRAIEFTDRATNLAPWNVTNGGPIKDFFVRRNREQYRNTQIAQGGTAKTDLRTDSFKGKGKDKTYTLSFPVSAKPTFIKVNSVEIDQSLIGVRGLDAGMSWYYQRGNNVISQDESATELAATDLLEVRYQGLYPISVEAKDNTEIAARQAIEGGSGIYEDIESLPDIDDEDSVREYAEAKVVRYARLNTGAGYITRTAGLKAGQLQTVRMDIHDINSTFLLTEVTLFDAGTGVHGGYHWQVNGADGDVVESWIQFYKKLADAGKSFTIRENEILVRSYPLSDGVTLSDSLGLVAATPEDRVDFADVGYSEVLE